jgi:hypothetical protein
MSESPFKAICPRSATRKPTKAERRAQRPRACRRTTSLMRVASPRVSHVRTTGCLTRGRRKEGNGPPGRGIDRPLQQGSWSWDLRRRLRRRRAARLSLLRAHISLSCPRSLARARPERRAERLAHRALRMPNAQLAGRTRRGGSRSRCSSGAGCVIDGEILSSRWGQGVSFDIRCNPRPTPGRNRTAASSLLRTGLVSRRTGREKRVARRPGRPSDGASPLSKGCGPGGEPNAPALAHSGSRRVKTLCRPRTAA